MAINTGLPVIRGHRARITRVGYCGRPIQGERNSTVFDGFISVSYERENSDGDEIEVKNASGAVCGTDRTPDQFKRFNVSMSLCGIHPEAIALMTGDPVTLDANGEVDGMLQQTGATGAGFALEVWAGTGGGEDCAPPTDDAILVTDGEGGQWWYFLTPWVRDATQGDLEINGTDAADVSISGFTGSGAHWGRGPYEVVRGVDGEADRLLSQLPARTHRLSKLTTVAPPASTNGMAPLALPTPYYGEATDALQPRRTTVTLPAGATGGTFTVTIDGNTTTPLAHDAGASAVQAAVRALGGAAQQATVSGTAGGPYDVQYTARAELTTNFTDITTGG